MLCSDPAHSLGPGISISSLSVSQARCAVGSEDGYLRLWPLDFSSVLLEAGGTVKPSRRQSYRGRAVSLGHPLARLQPRVPGGRVLRPGVVVIGEPACSWPTDRWVCLCGSRGPGAH